MTERDVTRDERIPAQTAYNKLVEAMGALESCPAHNEQTEIQIILSGVKRRLEWHYGITEYTGYSQDSQS